MPEYRRLFVECRIFFFVIVKIGAPYDHTLQMFRSHYWCPLILMIISSMVLNSCGRKNIWPSAVVEHFVTDSNSNLNSIWSRSGVTIERKDNPIVTTINASVVFNGSLVLSEPQAITALDAFDGRILFRVGEGYKASLFGTPNVFYVGDVSTITAYQGENGQTLWSKDLPFSGEVIVTYVTSDTIQVNTEARIFFSLSTKNGEIISTKKYGCCNIYLRTKDDTIGRAPNVNGLQATDTSTGKQVWLTELSSGFRQPPVFTKDMIFVRTGREIGSVYALSRDSGEILWEVKEIVSNIATIGTDVFFLGLDGTLIGVDSTSGEVQNQLRFEPNPLVLRDQQGYEKGYFVAADEQSRTIFVYLGDSTQLFAFQIIEK